MELSLEARMCVWKRERYSLTEENGEAIVTVRPVSSAPYLYFPGFKVTEMKVNGEPLSAFKSSDCNDVYCSGPVFMYFPYIRIYSSPNREVRFRLRKIAEVAPQEAEEGEQPLTFTFPACLPIALIIAVVVVAVVAWRVTNRRGKLPLPPPP